MGLAGLIRRQSEELRRAREAVLKAQRDDGGWAQLDKMESDAYATGQGLFVLQATGLAPSDSAYQRGVCFLLRTHARMAPAVW